MSRLHELPRLVIFQDREVPAQKTDAYENR